MYQGRKLLIVSRNASFVGVVGGVECLKRGSGILVRFDGSAAITANRNAADNNAFEQ